MNTTHKKTRLALLEPSERQLERVYRVGDLARISGKSVRAIHLYEEIGLLESPSRTSAGYRTYDEADLKRVEWVVRLQDMGLTLPEIRALLSTYDGSASAPEAMSKLRNLYREQLERTQRQRRKLEELEIELAQSLTYLETCESCAPTTPIKTCGSCDQHACDHNAPALVSPVF